ncbi:MsnO8 family LLM class oxidoreductase, partial [SAR202 cluster bacterium AD-802-E10_MRT_200m]|nr:MsnO8 family LLM class oxidoreductase [SAR202 cluster bacterium AD-802-E10_MRT_200m]
MTFTYVYQNVYPNRIELGIGRAPGSDQDTARALAYPKPVADINHFPQQVLDLMGFLSGVLPDEHPFSHVQAHPGSVHESIPAVWLLGSSDYSARLAAALGLPFSFADFFGTTAEHGPMIAELYRQQFRPSSYLKEPKFNVALQVICADSQEKADAMISSRNISRVNALKGIREPLISPEEAAEIVFTPFEQQHIDRANRFLIIGTPEIVKNGILEASEIYGTKDISI